MNQLFLCSSAFIECAVFVNNCYNYCPIVKQLTIIMDEMWSHFFSLRFDKYRTIGIQIRKHLINAITDGFLKPGELLPPTRGLAKELSVARNTVVSAYKELEQVFYIVAKNRSGCFVNPSIFESYPKSPHVGDYDQNKPPWLDKLLIKPLSSEFSLVPEDWQQSNYPFMIGQLDRSLMPFAPRGILC